MSMRLRMWRTLGSVGLAVVLGASLAVVASPAHADEPHLELYAPPIDRKKHDIAVLTQLPVGTQLEVLVNGKSKGYATLQALDEFTVIRYQKKWGLGQLQVRHGATTSKKARLSLGVRIDEYEFMRVGPSARKLRVTVRAQRFNAAKGKWAKAPRTTLEAKRNGKWKKVRNIKLNKKGKGRVTIKAPRALQYRLVVRKTKKNARTVQQSMRKI